MSAPKFARPVTLSTPSGRIGRVPTIFNSSLLAMDDMGFSGLAQPRSRM